MKRHPRPTGAEKAELSWQIKIGTLVEVRDEVLLGKDFHEACLHWDARPAQVRRWAREMGLKDYWRREIQWERLNQFLKKQHRHMPGHCRTHGAEALYLTH